MDLRTLSQGTCLWGYGERNFTPTTAFAMAGHSTAGKVASGGFDVDAPLYIKTLVFNPSGDGEIVLCYMDLLTGTIALLDKVHQLMPALVNRLVLVGSHTHYGPGNYFGNRFYDSFAQTSRNNPAGRNMSPALVDYLANTIVATVLQARGATQQGRVAVLQSKHWGSAANRSIEAFQQNPESGYWNQAGMPAANPPVGLHTLQHAIDPRITTILATNDSADQVCAFSTAACHSTCLGPYNNYRYSADWPGIAANYFENGAPAGQTYHAAFALSAAGDASSLDPQWVATGGGPNAQQGDRLKERRGLEIGEHVANVVASALPSVETATEPLNISLRSTSWSPTGGVARPMRAGWPLAAGAEDGHGLRPPLTEGIRLIPRNKRHRRRLMRRFPYQFPKRAILGPLQQLLQWTFDVPARHPLCQLQMGTHLFLSAPCELTSVAGLRTERFIKSYDQSIASASVLTSTNSYMGYITTREEYQLQQYEGGHNLFGFQTLDHFVVGHQALRSGGVMIGNQTVSQPAQFALMGGPNLEAFRTIAALGNMGLLEETTPATSDALEGLDQFVSPRDEVINRLQDGPVFETYSLEGTFEESAQDSIDDRSRRVALDHVWGLAETNVNERSADADVFPELEVDDQDYFEVSALFFAERMLKAEDLEIRYGTEAYEPELVANFGDLGENERNVVEAIFFLPGTPVEGECPELVLKPHAPVS